MAVRTRRRARAKVRGAVDLFRVAVGALMVVVLVATLSWLQESYDSADHRKAEALILGYRAAPGGPSIPELIVARHPYVTAKDLALSSAIDGWYASCVGVVRVTAYVPKRGEHPATAYSFDVRLTAPSIHPTDPTTVEIMKGLGARGPAERGRAAVGTASTATASPAAPRPSEP